MSDPSDIFRRMMEQSQAMARAMDPALENLSPRRMAEVFPTMPKEAMEAMFGDAFNPGGLDAKTRLLLTLAALTVQGAQADAQITLTVRHARAAGVSEKEIGETIAQMSVFAGVPAMTKAMELARAALVEREDERE